MYKKIKIITSPWSLAAIPLAVLAFILLQGWHTKTSADTLQHQNFPDKRVWAHIIPHGLPNFTEIGGGTEWGDLYSLDLVQGGYSSTPRPSDGVPRALQAGVTGVQILHFDFNHGSDFVFPWFAQADATWKDTDPKNDFMVAPCLEVSTPENASRIIKEYAEAAQGHPSAARIDGKLVIYTYGSFNMSPQQWSAARGQLGDLNNSVYIIGDLGTRASQYNYTVNMAAIAPYFPVFDASYAFEDSLDRIWSSLITLLNNNNRQYAGGVQPGYDRETCDIYCGYIDAAGTARYRDLWEKHLAAGTQWVNMITWNDMVERTEVQATSNWNSTRSDITAFYSAKLRGIAFPRPLAELYITTPQYVKAGQAIQAEG